MKNIDLKKVIQEELGINNKVVEISKEIYDKILENITNIGVEKNDTFSKQNISFSYNIDDCKITISVTYRNFYDKESFNFHNKPYITEGGSVMVSKNLFFCFLNIYGISGTIAKDKAIETIQHEIEHIFQQKQMGKRFGNENMYAKIKSDFDSDDEDRSKVGLLLYYSLKSEQEGFVNGLYAYLMDKNEPYNDELIFSSETWVIYLRMKEIYAELLENNNMKLVFNEYFVDYKLSFLSFLSWSCWI